MPGLGAQQQQDKGADAAAPPAAAAAAAANGTAEVPRSFQLAVAKGPDQVWTQVVGLQERAKLQVQAAAAAAPSSDGGAAAVPGSSSAGGPTANPQMQQQQQGEAALDPTLAQLLAKAGSIQGCWGKAMFGLTDVEVLQLMEALPKADKTPNYQFVDERGGWEKEREVLAKGRWARRSMMQAGAKKFPAKKPPQQQQGAAGGSPGGDEGGGAGGSGKGGGGSTPGSKKRLHPASAAAAAAAANAGEPSSLFGMQAPKRYRSVHRSGTFSWRLTEVVVHTVCVAAIHSNVYISFPHC
jgi:hypothetical protein